MKRMEWNSGAIVVLGKHVEHWLNGDKVLEYELGSRELAEAVRTNKAKVSSTFGTKIKSSLAILDKGEEVAFRNLKIRVLPATPPPAPPPLAAPPAAAPAPAATPVPVSPKPSVVPLPQPRLCPRQSRMEATTTTSSYSPALTTFHESPLHHPRHHHIDCSRFCGGAEHPN
jgi:hypothetical protein